MLRFVAQVTGLLCVCGALMVFVVAPQLQHWEDARTAQVEAEQISRALAEHRTEELLQRQLDELTILHQIAVPPNNDKLFTILSKGVGVTEWQFRPASVGTTPQSAFVTDLTSTPVNQQTDAFTQEFTITNLDGTDSLCWKPLAWASAGATCTAKCAAVVATFTCTGAATDGFKLAPGASISRRFDGTSCMCVTGSAAGVIHQTERIIR